MADASHALIRIQEFDPQVDYQFDSCEVRIPFFPGVFGEFGGEIILLGRTEKICASMIQFDRHPDE
jgi:hypothetical protein